MKENLPWIPHWSSVKNIPTECCQHGWHRVATRKLNFYPTQTVRASCLTLQSCLFALKFTHLHGGRERGIPDVNQWVCRAGY